MRHVLPFFRPLVRAKAVMCLYQYYLKLPELFQYATDSFYKSLSDPDPSVMAAACQIIYQLVKVSTFNTDGLTQFFKPQKVLGLPIQICTSTTDVFELND